MADSKRPIAVSAVPDDGAQIAQFGARRPADRPLRISYAGGGSVAMAHLADTADTAAGREPMSYWRHPHGHLRGATAGVSFHGGVK